MIAKNVEDCFKFVRDPSWDWFVTLRFCPDPAQSRGPEPDDEFNMWIGWVAQSHGGGGPISYVVVIEPCDNGEYLLHVLLCDVPETARKGWRNQWFALGGGWAWDRDMEGGVEGFLKYFYYKRRCKIVCVSHGVETEYQIDEDRKSE